MRRGEIIDDDMEDEFYLRRLDAGLFVLQLICYIMAEICNANVPQVKLYSRLADHLSFHPWYRQDSVLADMAWVPLGSCSGSGTGEAEPGFVVLRASALPSMGSKGCV